MLNWDQLPLTLTAFANWPPSTLYCTTEIGACTLVAEPANMKSTGTCAATIGDVTGLRLIAGAIGGMSRTMNVVETVSTWKSGSPFVRRNLKVARAFRVSCTNDPHGVDGLTVPVHCQLVPLGKVPATSGAPGPNCTLMLLLMFVQVAGANHEML